MRHFSRKSCSLGLVGLILLPTMAMAHQPVMDMAPRWSDGYGFQIRQEHYGSRKLLNGTSKTANPLGLKRYVNKTWVEGVYTFDRSKRVTFKLPYVQQNRIVNNGGAAQKQSSSGWGDLILGMPLKSYKNKGAFTRNFGFTPSLRLPTGSTNGPFAISDGSVDLGLSVSYSAETPKYYFMGDLYTWLNTEGTDGMREGNEVGLDLNFGMHPYHNNDTNSGFYVMWDISTKHSASPSARNRTSASGGTRVQTGPVFVLYRENIMLRTEYKHALYENVDGTSLSRGGEFNVGIGFTF